MSQISAVPASADTTTASAPRFELLEYWRIISKRKAAILAFAFSVTSLAAIVAFVMTPIYKSTATIMIESAKAKVVGIEDVYSGIGANREYFQTQAEIIKSREVAIRAIKEATLWNVPEFDPRPDEDSLKRKVLVTLGLVKDSEVEWTDDTLADAVYERLQKKYSVELVRLSQLAKITFESKNAAQAAMMANLLAKAYIDNDLQARFDMTQTVNDWLQQRLGELKAKWENSQRDLQAYREKEGLVDVKGMAQSGAPQQIADVSPRLVEARFRRAEAESAYSQVMSASKGSDLSSMPAVVRSSQVVDAQRQMSEAERKLAELAQRYGSEHPKYRQAEGELQSAKNNLRQQVDTVVSSIKREYESAKATERALESVMSSAKTTVKGMNRKEFELSLLERDVEVDRQIYQMFTQRTKETTVSTDIITPIARIVDHAIPDDAPAKPRKGIIIGVALVLGLFLGCLIALLAERLDDTLKTSEDVESRLRQSLLTALPILTKEEMARGQSSRMLLDQPQSLYSEGVRTARTGILLSNIDAPQRTLLVTSSLPGEGKTTFAINLALAHAQTKKTLLIEADMRRPTVGKGLGLTPGLPGLSNLVSATSPVSECLQRVEGTNLSVLTAGTIPPNPLELLISSRFKETLAQLSHHFEVIIIDSPPVQLVSDALVLSTLSTGVLFVARSAETPCPLIRKSLQRLQAGGATITGVVLNQLDFAKAEKYHGEYSGYGKYGDGYGGYGGYGSYGAGAGEQGKA